jgi:hypothetical protein
MGTVLCRKGQQFGPQPDVLNEMQDITLPLHVLLHVKHVESHEPIVAPQMFRLSSAVVVTKTLRQPGYR